MAHKATTWAWELDLPTPTHKVLLVALADMGDESFSCFPGQEKLARMVGTSVSTVRRTLKDLESWGLITREQRRRDDGYRSSDRYYLHLDKTSPVKLTGDISPVKTGTSPVKLADSHRSMDERAESLEESPVQNHQFVAKTPKPARGTRVPEDFPVSAAMREWAGANAPSANVDVETAKFVDHWKAAPGAKGVKSDWLAAWRNWLRLSHQWAVERGWKAPEPIHRFGRGENDAA